MKVKELIRLLQEEDPTGETEVCVWNHDIHFVSTEPAYWDGILQVLIRDENEKQFYNILGGKYVTTGRKIVIRPLSITDVLWDDADAIVDYSALHPDTARRYKAADDKTRELSKGVELKCEKDMFYRWVEKKAEAIRPGDKDELRLYSDSFFDDNLSPKDPLKDLPPKKDEHGYWYPSVVDRRAAQWDETIEVVWEGGWDIRKKA